MGDASESMGRRELLGLGKREELLETAHSEHFPQGASRGNGGCRHLPRATGSYLLPKREKANTIIPKHTSLSSVEGGAEGG